MDPQNNPYDFITNPAPAPKRPMFGGGGGGGESQGRRIMIVAVGGFGLLILAIIAWSVIGNLTKENMDDAVQVARTQRKIIFVAELALKDSTTPNVRSLAATVHASVSSDNTDLTDYLEKNVSKDAVKRIGDGEDEDIQADFEAAVQSGRIDDVFLSTLDELLDDYKSEIGTARGDAKNKTERDILTNANNDVTYFQKLRTG